MQLALTDLDTLPAAEPSETMELLSEAFARVLQRPAVGPDDDFFDLGGDSIMAVALVLEIEETTGIRLPTTTLFDAPSVTALARLLDERADTIPSSVVPLKPGAGTPALFIAPGVAGSAIELLPLAKLIEIDGPVYGLRAPGLDERETPLDSIEAMAAHYVPLIRAVQPHGPYYIAGYSVGGLTAVEIARLLLQAGETVALVALLDTIIHPKDLPLSTKARIWGRRVLHHAGRLRALRPRETLPYVLGRIPGMLADLGAGARARRESREQSRQSVVPATRRVIDRGLLAAIRYRRRFLPGTITFIEAVDNSGVPAHPDIVWGRQAERVVVHVVQGDHLNIMGRHAENLAARLSRCIREAVDAG